MIYTSYFSLVWAQCEAHSLLPVLLSAHTLLSPHYTLTRGKIKLAILELTGQQALSTISQMHTLPSGSVILTYS